MTTVLVVDDERQIRRALSLNFRARGYVVTEAASGEAALTQVADDRPDIVLLDLGLPGMDGIAVIEALRGWTKRADHRADRTRGRAVQGARARGRRRRLRHQAVRDG